MAKSRAVIYSSGGSSDTNLAEFLRTEDGIKILQAILSSTTKKEPKEELKKDLRELKKESSEKNKTSQEESNGWFLFSWIADFFQSLARRVFASESSALPKKENEVELKKSEKGSEKKNEVKQGSLPKEEKPSKEDVEAAKLEQQETELRKEAELREEIVRGGYELCVYNEEGEALGYVLYEKQNDASIKLIDKCVIKQKLSGEPFVEYAGKVYQALYQKLQSRFSYIEDAGSTRSIGFYRSFGFHIVGTSEQLTPSSQASTFRFVYSESKKPMMKEDKEDKEDKEELEQELETIKELNRLAIVAQNNTSGLVNKAIFHKLGLTKKSRKLDSLSVTANGLADDISLLEAEAKKEEEKGGVVVESTLSQVSQKKAKSQPKYTKEAATEKLESIVYDVMIIRGESESRGRAMGTMRTKSGVAVVAELSKSELLKKLLPKEERVDYNTLRDRLFGKTFKATITTNTKDIEFKNPKECRANELSTKITDEFKVNPYSYGHRK